MNTKNKKDSKNILANLQKGDTKLVDIAKFCEGYKAFLGECKLERECVKWGSVQLENEGYVNLDKNDISEEELLQGKFFISFNNVSLIAFNIHDLNINGFNIVMSHIDSPRLDLKPNALYEDEQLGLLKTNYYGGIKKYQWTAIPLSLRGVVVKENGDRLDINIGDSPTDPVFTITDLLPHLGKEQREKTLKDAILGEDLNVILGSKSEDGKKSKSVAVKKGLLQILLEEYGIKEEELLTADLSFVPSGVPRDLGIDRSMILAYAHDDKVCAYTSYEAFVSAQKESNSNRANNMLVWVTREETGSDGVGAAQDMAIEYAIARLYEVNKLPLDYYKLLKIFRSSTCLSADVDALMDPTYSSVYDTFNSARVNNGIILTKYTGSGGKYYTSEASAELIRKIVNIFNAANVKWQNGLLGKVDQGGGGTIAMYMANRGVQVIDCGPGVLSMHAPYEAIAKADVYESFLGYRAFYSSNL